MVAPVVGPTTEVIDLNPAYFRIHQRYKQKMPIDQPLPYYVFVSNRTKHVVFGSGLSINAYSMSGGFWGPPSYVANAANGLAYERLRAKVGEQASIGAALAELSQSTAMIAKRATQLFRAARAIRRLDFQSAAIVLGAKLPKGASRHKQFASNWLEFAFGWSPLVGDIYSGIDVLQGPLKSAQPRGSAKVPYSFKYYMPPGYWPGFDQAQGAARCRMGCEVRVTNPNLYLANALGLANPAVVLWEIVPFSFVVDWFANVEQFLSQGTDFLGLGITNAWTSQSTRFTATQYSSNPYAGGWAAFDVVRVNRTLGLTLPSLSLRPYKVPSWRRAASAVSLLVQQLGR